LKQLATDGFVVREGAFTPDELDRLRADCEDLTRGLVERASGAPKVVAGSYMFQENRELLTIIKWEPDAPDTVQGVEPFAHFHEPLRRWAYDPRFVEPMRDVLGCDAVDLFTEKLNLKRARVGGPVVLHQDYPYWVANSDDPGRIGTALVFLDDANRTNGCLEVAPGSHRAGVHQRRSVRGFGHFEMDPEAFDCAQLVALEVPAGTVVLFGSLLVHRSLPNHSQQDRRLLLYSYQPAGSPHSREYLAKMWGRSAPLTWSARTS
jgi:hypothetical protein